MKKKNNVAAFIKSLALFLLALRFLLWMSKFSFPFYIDIILFIVVIFLSALDFLMDRKKYTYSIYLIPFVLLLLFSVVFLIVKTKVLSIIFVVPFVTLLVGNDYKKWLFKYATFKIGIIIAIGIVFITLHLINPVDYPFGFNYKKQLVVVRFGFEQNLFCDLLFWTFVELFLFCSKPIKPLFPFATFSALGIVCYLIFYSDIILIASLITALLFAVSNSTLFKKIMNFIGPISFPLFLGTVLCFAYLIKERNAPSFVLFVDNLFTGRLTIDAKAIDIYGISLLPQNATRLDSIPYDSYYGLTSLTFDDIYVIFMVEIGLLFAIVYSIVFFIACKRNKDVKFHMGVFLFSLYGLAEMYSLYFAFCSIPLFSLMLFFDCFKKRRAQHSVAIQTI